MIANITSPIIKPGIIPIKIATSKISNGSLLSGVFSLRAFLMYRTQYASAVQTTIEQKTDMSIQAFAASGNFIIL